MPTNKAKDWIKELRGVNYQQVQLIVCIVPGARNKSPLYDEIKKIFGPGMSNSFISDMFKNFIR
jgi:hypothetical protein